MLSGLVGQATSLASHKNHLVPTACPCHLYVVSIKGDFPQDESAISSLAPSTLPL
jgi:hypothetical protein